MAEEKNSFSEVHPLAHKALVGVGVAASVVVGVFVVPKAIAAASSHAMKKGASIDIPDEGPVVVRTNDTSSSEENGDEGGED